MPALQLPSTWPAWIRAHKYLTLLLFLLVIVVVRPLTTESYLEGLALEGGGGLIALAFLAVTGQKRALLICSALIVAASVASVALYAAWETLSLHQRYLVGGTSIGLTIVFLCYICWLILRDIFTDPARSWDNIHGALSVYLLTGMLFANFYLVINLADPSSFDLKRLPPISSEPAGVMARSADFIYYSFVTLSTLGYGDIAPTAPLTRTLSWLEAVSGQLYLAVLVARLIAVQGLKRAGDDVAPGD